jgi:molybdopterin converting factor small subunit
MRVRVKLMGVLKEKTPPDGMLDVPDNATVAAVLEHLQIEPALVQACTLNGQWVRDRSRVLAEGDELVVLPPVGGG